MTSWLSRTALAALAFLSACAPASPSNTSIPIIAAADTPPVHAIVPAGYCAADDSDWADPKTLQTVGSNASWRPLGVFRPCAEGSRPTGRSATRIEVVARRAGGTPLFSDRAVFLAAQKDPAIAARFRQALSPTGKYQVRDLGVDDLAVYHGLERNPRDQTDSEVGLRLVVSNTIVDGWMLAVRIYNPTAGSSPRGWDDLKALAADTIHRTARSADPGQP